MTQEMRDKISNGLKGFKRPPETIAKMCLAQKGRVCTEQQKTRQRAAMLGKKHTEETKKKMSEMRQGENSANWKGGITTVELQVRHCFKSRQWVSDIFTRDDFICQECGDRGGKLNAHHIDLFSDIIKRNNIKTLDEALLCDELWNLNNGITLCKHCHLIKHKKNG